MPKGFTVRLPDAQVSRLATLATYDGVAIAEEIRRAIERHIESRSSDPEFVARVAEAFKNAHEILAAVKGGDQILAALGGEEMVRELEKSERKKIGETTRRVAAARKTEESVAVMAAAAGSRARSRR